TGHDLESFVSTGQGSLFAATDLPSKLVTHAFSIYGQDTWRLNSRLTLTYGLRWELNPPPSARGKTTLAAWENVSDPAQIALAPSGTSLWKTTYGNFAPRVGLAYQLTENGDFVVRAGWGFFYDPGVGQAASLTSSFPNSFAAFNSGASLPVTNASQ